MVSERKKYDQEFQFRRAKKIEMTELCIAKWALCLE